MPNVDDPVVNAAKVTEAMRMLAHTTKRIEDRSQCADIVGSVSRATGLLRLVLMHVAEYYEATARGMQLYEEASDDEVDAYFYRCDAVGDVGGCLWESYRAVGPAIAPLQEAYEAAKQATLIDLDPQYSDPSWLAHQISAVHDE